MIKPIGPESVETVLSRFPEDTRPLVLGYFNAFTFELRITPPRKQRLGSFRASGIGGVSTISINNDLGRYSFLIVFLHELAHLLVWEKYKRRAKPHGEQWKNEYRKLLSDCIGQNLFPSTLRQSVLRYMKVTPASFQRDPALFRILHELDGKGVLQTVADIPENQEFQLADGKRMVKLERIRTRYRCYCPSNKRYYLVSPAAQIFIQTG